MNTAENHLFELIMMSTPVLFRQLRAGALDITPVTHQLPVTFNCMMSSVSNPVSLAILSIPISTAVHTQQNLQTKERRRKFSHIGSVLFSFKKCYFDDLLFTPYPGSHMIARHGDCCLVQLLYVICFFICRILSMNCKFSDVKTVFLSDTL